MENTTKNFRKDEGATQETETAKELVPCTGEAHNNPYIDHCSLCLGHKWGFMPKREETETAKEETGYELFNQWLEQTSPFEEWVVKAVSCLVPEDKAVYTKKGNDSCRYSARCDQVDDMIVISVRKNGKHLYTEKYFPEDESKNFIQLPFDGEIRRKLGKAIDMKSSWDKFVAKRKAERRSN